MTPRERFIRALECRPIEGRVPHFELVFYLTMEVFGRVHPCHRRYDQWDQMSERERNLHRRDMAEIYIMTARRYEHSAILLHPNPPRLEEALRLIEYIRERTGEEYFLMLHGDATFSIPSGGRLAEFSYRLADDPAGVKEEAERRVEEKLEAARRLQGSGLDGFALCADYCFNTGPFLAPEMFAEFVAPYLKKLIGGYRELGFYTIKHTDGNIMPILDALVDARPHALHSLDPQGGVDIAEVRKRVGDRMCLIGNVSCAALDTGTEEDVRRSARYCLREGMRGWGYVFSSSNCIYTGMDVRKYECMLEVWREEGNYPARIPDARP